MSADVLRPSKRREALSSTVAMMICASSGTPSDLTHHDSIPTPSKQHTASEGALDQAARWVGDGHTVLPKPSFEATNHGEARTSNTTFRTRSKQVVAGSAYTTPAIAVTSGGVAGMVNPSGFSGSTG